MKRFLLLLALLCGVSAPLSAQQNRELINNTHEFRLGTYILTPYLGQYYDVMNRTGYSDEFDRSKFIEGDYVDVPAKALTYTYRTSNVMEFGAQLSYTGNFTPYYSAYTGELSHIHSSQYITLMPYARATWLNTPWVRLYSSFAIGLTAEFQNKQQRDFMGAVQFTPVGITIGRELFGYGEILTIGSNGFGTLGIGYRF